MIIGILLAIAVPSYLGFKDRANKRAAQSNVRAAIPRVEAFYPDPGTYVGLDDRGDEGDRLGSRSMSTVRRRWHLYCLADTVGGTNAHAVGPGGKATADRNCAGT